MLVLSRKKEESIIIGDKITIKILEIGHNRVRLGIDAPRDINVVREEIADKEPEGPDNAAQVQ